MIHAYSRRLCDETITVKSAGASTGAAATSNGQITVELTYVQSESAGFQVDIISGLMRVRITKPVCASDVPALGWETAKEFWLKDVMSEVLLLRSSAHPGVTRRDAMPPEAVLPDPSLPETIESQTSPAIILPAAVFTGIKHAIFGFINSDEFDHTLNMMRTVTIDVHA